MTPYEELLQTVEVVEFVAVFKLDAVVFQLQALPPVVDALFTAQRFDAPDAGPARAALVRLCRVAWKVCHWQLLPTKHSAVRDALVRCWNILNEEERAQVLTHDAR